MAAGYPKQKWVIFCEVLIAAGFRLNLYEARQTESKYITVTRKGEERSYKVRFSSHRPNIQKDDPCDFFVGYSSRGITTTEQALAAVRDFFEKEPAREACPK